MYNEISVLWLFHTLSFDKILIDTCSFNKIVENILELHCILLFGIKRNFWHNSEIVVFGY